MDQMTSFEQHLEKYRGSIGSPERAKFDAASLAYRSAAMLEAKIKKGKPYDGKSTLDHIQ